jgi:hypothetical protein
MLITTLLFLLPSEPFRQGMFSFYLHSWFHLYVATCTAIACVYFAMVRRSPRSVAALAGICLILTIPIISQVTQGGDFLFARIMEYDKIAETQSVIRYVINGEWWRMSWFYSLLVWVLALTLAYLYWRLRSDRSDSYLFFFVMSLFEACFFCSRYVSSTSAHSRCTYPGAFGQRSAATVPGGAAHRTTGSRHPPPTHLSAVGIDHSATARRSAPTICTFLPDRYIRYCTRLVRRGRASCLLSNEGHFITYHSDCSVIADGFILTRQHQEKVLQAHELLGLSLNQLLEKALCPLHSGPPSGCLSPLAVSAVGQNVRECRTASGTAGWRATVSRSSQTSVRGVPASDEGGRCGRRRAARTVRATIRDRPSRG